MPKIAGRHEDEDLPPVINRDCAQSRLIFFLLNPRNEMRANQQTALVSDRVVLVPYRSVLWLAGRF